MKAVVFGATGMVGQAILRGCLLDPEVEQVVAVTRAPLGQQHPKLREIRHQDFTDFTPIASELTGLDACFFCLGISSVGMTEEAYHRVTHDFTLAAAKVLLERSPALTFVFVSGAGTDSTERGRSMWARVKGKTENALLRLPFRGKYMIRPGFIQPLHGITTRTRLYRIFYVLTAPFFPLWKALFPGFVTDTDRLARAMLTVARKGAASPILETRDINRIAA